MKIDLKINHESDDIDMEIFIGYGIVLTFDEFLEGYINFAGLDNFVVIHNYKIIRKMGNIIQKHYEIEKILSEICK